MKYSLLFVGLIVCHLLVVPHAVEGQNDADFEPPSTYFSQDIKLRDALRLTNPLDPDHFVVDPDVPDVRLTVNIERVRPYQAMRILVRQASLLVPGLTLQKDGDIPHILIRPGFTAQAIAEEKLTLKLRKAEASTAWRRILTGTNIDNPLPAEAQKVKVTLRDEKEPRRVVVYHFLRQLSGRVSNLQVDPYDWRIERVKPEPKAARRPDQGIAPSMKRR